MAIEPDQAAVALQPLKHTPAIDSIQEEPEEAELEDIDADEVDAFLRDHDDTYGTASTPVVGASSSEIMNTSTFRGAAARRASQRRRRRRGGLGGPLWSLPLRLAVRAFDIVSDAVSRSDQAASKQRLPGNSSSEVPASRFASIRRTGSRVAVIYLLFTTFVFFFFAYLAPLSSWLLPTAISNARRVLLVVAHPDDECLFFSPTLSTFTYRLPEKEVSILVMSVGNNYGVGTTRRDELQGSCAAFSIPPDRCQVLDVPDIQDSPTVWWPITEVAEIIGTHVQKWGIDTVISFDEGGISGHINHRAVAEATKLYGEKHPNKNIFLVYTTSTLRKYTVWFDFAWTVLPTVLWRMLPFTDTAHPSKAYVIHDFGLWRVAYRAFVAHASQWNVPRTLFLYINRYMWYNELLVQQLA